MSRIVVVGAGLAGLRSAQELRWQGFDGELTVIGTEEHLPYDRPPLSKGVLLGKTDPSEIGLLPADQEAELAARWLLGRTVVRIETGADQLDTVHTGPAPTPSGMAGTTNPAAGSSLTIVLADGERIPADGIVLAAGARPRDLPVANLPGVHTLRTLQDSLALKSALQPGTRLSIVGAGLIGSEVAAAATSLGVQVHLIEPDPAPFARLFDTDIAARLRDLHTEHGVRWYVGAALAEIGGSDRVEWVRLTDGTRLPTDAVLISVGAVPNTEFLAGSGVACDGGVRTDEFGRTTVPHIVAAGDIARYRAGSGEQIRYEHWTNARDMPAIAVAALLADISRTPQPGPYDPVPYFWSDQYGHHLQVAGRLIPGAPSELVDGTLADAFVLTQHRPGDPTAITAVLGWDSPRIFNRLRKRLRV